MVETRLSITLYSIDISVMDYEETTLRALALTWQDIFNKVNIERQKRNVKALVIDEKVQRACTNYCNLMAARNKLSHTLDGTVGSRLTRVGFRWMACAENIAWGTSSPVNGWLESPGHRTNMLNPRYKYTGVAVSGKYYCQVFANG